MKKELLELKPADAAIIISEDFEVTTLLPEPGKDDPAPGNVLAMVAIAMRITSDQEWADDLMRWVKERNAELKAGFDPFKKQRKH